MTTVTYPDPKWQRISPAEAGFDPERLARAKQWLDEHQNQAGYRFVIVRNGYLVFELYDRFDPDRRLPIASAAKSIYANILGIILAEKRLPSPDVEVYDYYPEMMEVPEGAGPKKGRYAFAKDRHLTFRQLISNTSGYMKPGEKPGQVFHYQTYGMNIFTHALAKIYGLYNVNDPAGSPGFAQLIEQKIGYLIGSEWDYSLANFDLHKRARLNVFGYYCQIHSMALDLARLGWLWCNWGRWKDRQVIPEAWMRETVQVAPDIVANCPKEEWLYGYGTWTNAHNLLWPGLPRDGFSACGAGGHYISVFPSLGLVVVQNPGRYIQSDRGNIELLKIILDALKEA